MDMNRYSKKNGCGLALSACKRLLKYAITERLRYPFYIEGQQVISNGHLCVIYNEGYLLPFEDCPSTLDKIDMERIINGFRELGFHPVDTPILSALSSWIKVDKAKNKGDKHYCYPIYIFEDGNKCGFNSFYIEQVMIMLGKKNLYFEIDSTNRVLKISGVKGTAYILGIITKDNKNTTKTEI